MSPENRLDELKASVVGALGDLAAVADDTGLSTLAKEVRDERVPKLERGDFLLVVIGEFNHGKTTFVNALLGREVLPAGVTPTTATIHEVTFGERSLATVVGIDGSRQAVALGDLARYTCEGGAARNRLEGSDDAKGRGGRTVSTVAAVAALGTVARIELRLPVDMLKGGVTVVDTPGVNDLNQQRVDITYGYLPRADAVLFILDATQILKRSEERFLKQRVLRPSREKVIFVANKIDLLEGDEVDEALGFARRHLHDWIPEPYLFAVSSSREIAGKPESGFAELRSFLQRHLEDERGKILLDNAVGEALRASAFLRETLAVKRSAILLPADELAARTELLRRRLKESEAHLADLASRIDDGATRAKGVVEDDLKDFVEVFVSALPREIDRVGGGELKQHLAPFIEAKWKEWAESEGEKVARTLEALAEEVVHGVGEAARKRAEALYDELGLAGQRMPLQVDTFAYDATVFAVGAFGTSIMLFVNFAVGGLLTLAAPILAVVLRERVTVKLRAQAKIEGAKAIRAVADKVGPEFDAVITRFADRLKEFVATAGAELHRGLLEMFERVAAERKQTDRSIAGSEAEVAAVEARLTKVDEVLWAAKEKVWG